MDWWQALREYRAETQRFAREHGIRLPLRRLVKWYPAWRRHRPEVANPLSDRKPWINFLGFRHLKRILRPDMRMFEYGAGGSTLFFAQRVRSLVSVEHDPQWLAKTEAAMKGIGASNWEAILEPPTAHQEPSNPDPADPNSYVSSDRRYEGLSFRRYVSSIDRFEPNHFDLIFLDGRARPSCLKHALGRLKIGGYLILDNADVGHYARVVEAIQRAGWPGKIHYSPGPYGYRFWVTAIWSKPSGEMVLNPYLSLPNWEYQKTIIEPHLTPDSVVLDVGCGNNPAPPATV